MKKWGGAVSDSVAFSFNRLNAYCVSCPLRDLGNTVMDNMDGHGCYPQEGHIRGLRRGFMKLNSACKAEDAKSSKRASNRPWPGVGG
jgi:hypothetical protein